MLFFRLRSARIVKNCDGLKMLPSACGPGQHFQAWVTGPANTSRYRTRNYCFLTSLLHHYTTRLIRQDRAKIEVITYKVHTKFVCFLFVCVFYKKIRVVMHHNE